MTQFQKKATKTGMSPGSVVFTGEQLVEKTRITVIDYDNAHHQAVEIEQPEMLSAYRDSASVSWINIDGLHDTALIEKVGSVFNVHPLMLEDVVNPTQRPKLEIGEHDVYIVLKMIEYNAAIQEIEVEQISIIVGDNYVLTFQETIGDMLDPLRKRIEYSGGRLRKRSADYLAYAIIDIIVDHYFVVIEALGEELTELDEAVLADPDENMLKRLYRLKRELIYLRKSLWPVREIAIQLERDEAPLFKKGTRTFIRDLHDHILQAIETVESYREMAGGIMDIYLTTVSNRMNEVMKVLTIIATIFIPLSFLAGVYGMNFDPNASPFNLPELQWKYGYVIFWFISIAIAGGLLVFFRKRKWI